MFSFPCFAPKINAVVQVFEVAPPGSNFHSGPSAVTRKERPSALSPSPKKKPVEVLPYESFVDVVHPPRKKKVHFPLPGEFESEIPVVKEPFVKRCRTSSGNVPHSILKSTQTSGHLDLTPPTSARSLSIRCIGIGPMHRNCEASRCVIKTADKLTDLLSRHVSSAEDIQCNLRYLDGGQLDDLDLPEVLFGLRQSGWAMRRKLRSVLDGYKCHKLGNGILLSLKIFRDHLEKRFEPLDRLMTRLTELVAVKKTRCVAVQVIMGRWTDCVREEAKRVCEIVEQFEADTAYFVNWIEECVQGKMRGSLQNAAIPGVVVVKTEKENEMIEERVQRKVCAISLTWEERSLTFGSLRPGRYNISMGA